MGLSRDGAGSRALRSASATLSGTALAPLQTGGNQRALTDAPVAQYGGVEVGNGGCDVGRESKHSAATIGDQAVMN